MLQRVFTKLAHNLSSFLKFCFPIYSGTVQCVTNSFLAFLQNNKNWNPALVFTLFLQHLHHHGVCPVAWLVIWRLGKIPPSSPWDALLSKILISTLRSLIESSLDSLGLKYGVRLKFPPPPLETLPWRKNWFFSGCRLWRPGTRLCYFLIDCSNDKIMSSRISRLPTYLLFESDVLMQWHSIFS